MLDISEPQVVLGQKVSYDKTFRVKVMSKQVTIFFLFWFWTITLSNHLYLTTHTFVCLSVSLQVSYIPLCFSCFYQRFSFCTVNRQIVPPTVQFSRKRIGIIFRGRYQLWNLKSAKNNSHVFRQNRKNLATQKYPIKQYAFFLFFSCQQIETCYSCINTS